MFPKNILYTVHVRVYINCILQWYFVCINACVQSLSSVFVQRKMLFRFLFSKKLRTHKKMKVGRLQRP